MKCYTSVFWAVVWLVSSGGSTSAGFFTLDATDSGFVTEMGGSAKGDGTLVAAATYNYSVGQEEHYGDGSLGMPPGTTPLAFMDRNNYFVFDLSSVTGTIVSASLLLPAGILESVDLTETFDLLAPLDPGAALSDSDALLVGNLTIGSTAFDAPTDPLVGMAAALYGNIEGGPTVLGSVVISSADDGMILSIPLTPAGLGYLSAFAGGPVFLGGSVSTITPGPTTEQPFGGVAPGIPAMPPGSDPSIPMLVIETAEIPEPATFLLAALGMLMFPVCAQRRRMRLLGGQ